MRKGTGLVSSNQPKQSNFAGTIGIFSGMKQGGICTGALASTVYIGHTGQYGTELAYEKICVLYFVHKMTRCVKEYLLIELINSKNIHPFPTRCRKWQHMWENLWREWERFGCWVTYNYELEQWYDHKKFHNFYLSQLVACEL